MEQGNTGEQEDHHTAQIGKESKNQGFVKGVILLRESGREGVCPTGPPPPALEIMDSLP